MVIELRSATNFEYSLKDELPIHFVTRFKLGEVANWANQFTMNKIPTDPSKLEVNNYISL